MKTIYAIEHGPRFYRLGKKFSDRSIRSSGVGWEEVKTIELESMLIRTIREVVIKDSTSDGVTILPLDMLIHLEEGYDEKKQERSLLVHIERIESLERRYEEL